MRVPVTIACVVLVLTSGCAGFLGSEQTDTPTVRQTPADSAASTDTTEPTETSTATPGSTTTSTPTATSTVSPPPTPTAASTPTPKPPAADNPWGTRTVEVTFNDQTESSRDFTPAVKSALDYWNGRTAQYTEYNVTFVYRPNITASESDLLVVASQPIDVCGGPVDHEVTTGCYRNEHRVDVFENRTNLQFRNTLIHEVGHALDLRHRDDPKWAMSTAAVDYEGEITNATARENPWNTTGPLKLAVAEDIDDRQQHVQELRDVADYYNTNDQLTPGDMQLEVVDHWYEAHVIVNGSHPPDESLDDRTSIASIAGISYDADRANERFEAMRVYLGEVSSADSEWHVGGWVGYSLLGNWDDVPAKYSN